MDINFFGTEYTLAVDEGVVGTLAAIVIVAAIVIALGAVVLYVLKSLGLYNIAKRRGIACAWLAWLPVGCEWIAGSIADQYRKVTTGKGTIRRFIIIALAVISIAMSVLPITMMTDKAEQIEEFSAACEDFSEYMEENGEYVDEEVVAGFLERFFEELGSLMGVFFLMSMLSAFVAVVSRIYWYVSVGDVYASCCPKKGTMMLVLSFFLPVLEPFFIFCNKNKDAGMIPMAQPRVPVQPAQVQRPVPQAPVKPVQPVREAPKAPVAPVQPVWEAPKPVEPAQPVWEAPKPVEPAQPVWEAPVVPAEPVQPSMEPVQSVWEAPVEPWAGADSRPEPWNNPEN